MSQRALMVRPRVLLDVSLLWLVAGCGVAAAAESAGKPAAGDPAEDCDSVIAAVRQGCADRYHKGLLVDCDNLASTLSISTIADRAAHPPGSTKAKVAAVMCAGVAKKLREERAQADAVPVAAACVNLGERLASNCFSMIGTAEYLQSSCSAWLSSSRPLTEESCRVTMQAAGFR